MLYFITEGNNVRIKDGDNDFRLLHNTSNCINWTVYENKIDLSVDELTFDNIDPTHIYFDGVSSANAAAVVTSLKDMFPNLGGGASYLVKTYAEIVALIGTNGLVTGTQYQISDYATKHFIVDTDGTQYLSDIITGVNEPLIVTANSANTLDKNARSALHPEDVIYYDWNPANWLDDLSFSDLTGAPVIITGFKGVIYFRHDTLLDNYMGYDFRNCKFRRWKTDVAVWNIGTAYIIGNYVTYLSKIYKALQGSTGEQPNTSPAYWVMILDLTTVEYWNNNPTSTNGIVSNPALFDDFLTFAPLGTDTYEIACRSNHFESFKDENNYYDLSATLLSNNVFYLFSEGYYNVYSNKIAAESYSNTIGGAYFNNNSIEARFIGNSIGTGFNNNSIGSDFYYNSIGIDFNSNSIETDFNSNSIEEGFNNNSIGARFIGNSIGAYFNNNSIGAYFNSNSIGTDFNNNSIGSGFNNNSIGSGFKKVTTQPNVSSQTMGGWTLIYADHPKELIEGLTSGEYWVRYIDGDGVQQIVTAST